MGLDTAGEDGTPCGRMRPCLAGQDPAPQDGNLRSRIRPCRAGWVSGEQDWALWSRIRPCGGRWDPSGHRWCLQGRIGPYGTGWDPTWQDPATQPGCCRTGWDLVGQDWPPWGRIGPHGAGSVIAISSAGLEHPHPRPRGVQCVVPPPMSPCHLCHQVHGTPPVARPPIWGGSRKGRGSGVGHLAHACARRGCVLSEAVARVSPAAPRPGSTHHSPTFASR